MLFWSCVDFTSDRRLLNVLWTDWICLGIRLEQTFFETENAFAHMGLDADARTRVQLVRYKGGHMVYLDASNRKKSSTGFH